MGSNRLLLWVAFVMAWLLVYQAWVADNAPTVVPPVVADNAETTNSASVSASQNEQTLALASSVESINEPAASGELLILKNDLIELNIDSLQGDLVSAVLLKYPVNKGSDERVTLLMQQAEAQKIVRTGLQTAVKPLNLPFTVDRARTTSQQIVLLADLGAEGGQGRVEKTLTLPDDSYVVTVEQRVTNNGQETIQLSAFGDIEEAFTEHGRSMVNVESYSYYGPVAYNGKKYEKLKPKDLGKRSFTESVEAKGWVAAIQHHFLVGIIPPSDAPSTLSAELDNNSQLKVSISGADVAIPSQSTQQFSQQIFLGPKDQDRLSAVADGLTLTVDYGYFTVFSQPLFWVLKKLHDLVGNWGWAIVLLTLLIKAVFYKLAHTSGKSMARMRKLQPRMKTLQERYKDDRQKLSQAMMKLYKEEKVNPVAGCLPILIQMPVFIALYWVLIESVELRQAPFILWINDLSARDPYFVLPVLMGIFMFAQQKLNPAPTDPNMARAMMIMPFVMTIFFAFFPAGLVLYWFMNTLLSVIQQYLINRSIEKT